MSVQINLWAVLLGGIVSMVISALYYSQQAFGGEWMELAKVSKTKYQKQMPRVMPLIALAALATSYVVAYVAYLYHYFFRDNWVSAGLSTALILWLGVAATSIFIHNALDQRRRMLTVITLANRLLALLGMGLVIGLLHP